MKSQEKIGIYQIYNKITKQSYIGSSINIKKRLGQHKYDLNNNHHGNSHLQRSWNKYGDESFDFNILLNCDKKYLLENEDLKMNEYDSIKNGFNMRTAERYIFTKEVKEKISKKKIGHIVTKETREKISKARKKQVFKYICECCGDKYESKGSGVKFCDTCKKEQYNEMKRTENDRRKDSAKKIRHLLTCKFCQKEYESKSNKKFFCFECDKIIKKIKKEIVSEIRRESRLNTTFINICKKCNNNFESRSNRKKFCKNCE